MSQNRNPNFVLELRSVHKRFAGPRGKGLFASRQDVHAVDDVSLCLQRSEVLGIVGESGCGKSTVARLMTFLPTFSPYNCYPLCFSTILMALTSHSYPN